MIHVVVCHSLMFYFNSGLVSHLMMMISDINNQKQSTGYSMKLSTTVTAPTMHPHLTLQLTSFKFNFLLQSFSVYSCNCLTSSFGGSAPIPTIIKVEASQILSTTWLRVHHAKLQRLTCARIFVADKIRLFQQHLTFEEQNFVIRKQSLVEMK